MSINAMLRATARALSIIGLAACGAAAPFAQASDRPATFAERFAMLTPFEALPLSRSAPMPEPFAAAQRGVASSLATANLSAKWRALQPAMALETQVLAMCRANAEFCSPEGTRFLAAVDAAGGSTGRARVGLINRAINLAIRPMSDVAQYQVPDVWSSPLMTFASGAGDCEDFAIAKYLALRVSGMAAADLRLVIVRDRVVNQDHAVIAARVDGEWLILDNRGMLLRADSQIQEMTPIVSLGAPDEDRPMAAAT